MIFSFKPSDSLDLELADDDSIRRLREPEPTGIGTLGVKLFIASLAFIFGATILLYVLLMTRQDPPDTAVMPIVRNGLLISTALIVLSSVTLSVAIKSIRANDVAGLSKWLKATLGLGLLFMVSQAINWWQMIDAGLEFDFNNRHAALFVILTVLHLLHVVGGLARLFPVTSRAVRGEYSAANYEPVTNVALYWHFLDVVWILMLIAILAVSR